MFQTVLDVKNLSFDEELIHLRLMIESLNQRLLNLLLRANVVTENKRERGVFSSHTGPSL